jgi:hypothetical protein
MRTENARRVLRRGDLAGSNERWRGSMRHHDLRMALAAIVAFGPVVFAAAYGVANASRLQAAGATTVASAPVRAVAAQPAPGEERAMGIAPLASTDIISASLDGPPSMRQKTQLVR